MIRITMFPAGNGDSFLITSVGQTPTSILIDGGYASTCHNYIVPALTQLAASGTPLDLAVATHIDADHITGIIAVLDTLQSRGIQCPIKLFWHNSLRCLAHPTSAPDPLPGDLQLLQAIAGRGMAPTATQLEAEISSLQGSTLASRLRQLSLTWNEGSGLTPIAAPMSHQLNPGVTIRVLGPSSANLASLRNLWISEIRRLGITASLGRSALVEDAFEYICSRESQATALSHPIASSRHLGSKLSDVYVPDTSITNKSSISLLINIEGISLLFLGDASAEDVLDSLNSTMPQPPPWEFDVIKVSHHGSLRNTSPSLLNAIDSTRFLISTDGDRHGHPDIEVLKAIVDRPTRALRHLYFNFSTAVSHAMLTYKSNETAPFQVHAPTVSPIEIEST